MMGAHLIVSFDTEARLLGGKDFTLVRRLALHPRAVNDVRLAPGGQRLITAAIRQRGCGA